MLEVIDYMEKGTKVSVGFKKHNFVVYSEIGTETNLGKSDYLQKMYEQVKTAIDYELKMFEEGKENTILTDKIGEVFTPNNPEPSKLEVDFGNLAGKVLDQYGDIYSEDIKFSIEGTKKVVIENNAVKESSVEEDTNYSVLAKYEILEKRQERTVYAYKRSDIEILEEQVYKLLVEAPSIGDVSSIQNELVEIQGFIVEKEYENLLIEGGL